MSDWGIGIGLKGLYGSQNFAERKKAEQETMQLYTQQVEKDKLAEEAAQLRQQQYDEKISAFSDKLLAPDRDRINKKAGVLSMRIREELKMHGGNMGKFLAAGGHSMMEDYKNGVIKSEEASAYLDNKKNSDLILQLQSSGKGHLITKRDLNNFKSYGEKSEGKITYSGMLNEIKLPDADGYEWGQKIPAKDILRLNKLQAYGNYKMEYPDAPEPTDYDLEVYIDQNYGGVGKEWQRAEAIKREENRHQEEVSKQQADYLVGMAKAAASGKGHKTYKDEDGNTVEMDANGQMVSRNGVKNPDYKDAKGVGGFTRSMTEEIQRGIGRNPKLTVNDWYDAKGNKKAGILSPDFLKVSSPIDVEYFTGTDMPTKEKQKWGIDINGVDNSEKGTWARSMAETFHDQYVPANARQVFKEVTGTALPYFLGGNVKYDSANKTVTGWKPNSETFMANGVQIKNNDDPTDLESYAGDYTVKGIISVGTTKGTGKGKLGGGELIVMDQMNGKTVHKRNALTQKEEYGGSGIEQKLAVVLENKNGDQFYQTVGINDHSMAQLMKTLKDKDNIADLSEAKFNKQNSVDYNKSQNDGAVQDTKAYWDELANNKTVWQNIPREVAKFSANGEYNNARVNLFKTFHVAVAMADGETSTAALKNYTTNPSMALSTEIEEYDKAGFKYNGQNLSEMIKDLSHSDEEIITALINFSGQTGNDGDIPMLQAWLENAKYLNKVRTK